MALTTYFSTLLFSTAIVSICYGAAIPTTSSPSPARAQSCSVTPNGVVIQDSACIQETLLAELRHYTDDNNRPPRCNGLGFRLGQAPSMRVFQSLSENVEFLDSIETSPFTANFSDILCRMRTVVLPSLNETLTSLCNCQEDCNTMEEESTSRQEETAPAAFCVVSDIQSTLRALLNRIVNNRHVIVSSGIERCQVNFTTRSLLTEMKEEVINLERELQTITRCPSIPLPTSVPENCIPPLYVVKQLPNLLRQGELIFLADSLENAIPIIENFLQVQRNNCSTVIDPLPSMNNYCLSRVLKSNFLSLYNSLRLRFLDNDIQLDYKVCAYDSEEMALEQMVEEGTSSTTDSSASDGPTQSSRWRTVTLPERPS